MNPLAQIEDRDNGRVVTFRSTSRVFTDGHSHLVDLAARLSTGPAPVVLWNIAPSEVFTVLHAIYAEKLKQLAALGFKCVVTIFDSYERDRRELNGEEVRQIRRNCDRLASRILATGIQASNIEIVLESHLRGHLGGESEFVRGLTLLAGILDEGAGDAGHLASLGGLFEVYYESIIDADLVLTGGDDAATTWDFLRRSTSRTSHFGSHAAPLLGVFPMFTGTNGELLTATNRAGSVCVGDRPQEVRAIMARSGTEFVGVAYNYLLSPIAGPSHSSFAEAIADLGDARVRLQVAEFLIAYFQDIHRADQ